VIDMLKSNGITSIYKLAFAEADLSKDDDWDEAMKGCDYVLSVASPVFLQCLKLMRKQYDLLWTAFFVF